MVDQLPAGSEQISVLTSKVIVSCPSRREDAGMSHPIRLAERPAEPAFADLLKHWRGVRRLSQLALATEAEISARHLAFLETGRARPSREMVRLLGHVLDLPFGEQNALLLAAGYAPIFAERDLGAPELTPVQRALEFILAKHEPYPAIVIDGRWDIRMRNAASARIFGALRRHYEMSDELARNAMHVACHPRGLRQFVLNWEEFVAPLVQAVHREAAHGSAASARLRDALLAYPGIPATWNAPDARAPDSPLLTMRFKHGALALTFFTTLTAFAMPRDVTLQQLKIECFYPADAGTVDALRRLASQGDDA
jgi:transcriptional regulator with XRE-family HTH domain